MNQSEINYALSINSEAEYHDATSRLAEELLKENTPEPLAKIAAQHIIYVDFLKASADAAEASSTAEDQLIPYKTRTLKIMSEALALSIAEGRNKLTPRQAAQFTKMAIRASKSAEGQKNADLRHSGPGGSREKRDSIRAAWASGKYSSRDICAEQECAALGISFSTARKALRNTPDHS